MENRTIQLETQHLVLRKFNINDVAAVYKNWGSQDEVYKYLPWNSQQSMTQTKEIVEQWISKYADPYRCYWCIELKGLNESIGSLYLVDYDPEKQDIEAGFCIGKDYWGNGYVSEALRCVCVYLLTEKNTYMPIRRIWARHDCENFASGVALKKAGFKLVKEIPSFSATKQENVLAAFYEMTREMIRYKQL